MLKKQRGNRVAMGFYRKISECVRRKVLTPKIGDLHLIYARTPKGSIYTVLCLLLCYIGGVCVCSTTFDFHSVYITQVTQPPLSAPLFSHQTDAPFSANFQPISPNLGTSPANPGDPHPANPPFRLVFGGYTPRSPPNLGQRSA